VTAQRPTLRAASATPASRPRRGRPEETRRRLVAAAGVEFNRQGYAAVDSNEIARAAGYSPGTFYKHFADKRSIFVAVYAEWVAREWQEVESLVSRGASATELVTAVVDLHRRWRGLRRSLRALVADDADVRRAYVDARARQLDTMARLRRRRREDDALLLYLMERTADAIADGEPAALGISEAKLVAELAERLGA
jgi:AcrR family transcriptional regulator